MISIRVEGLQETIDYLQRIRKRAASDATWQPSLLQTMRGARRYAQSISPVVTGSYRGAHQVVVKGKTGTLSISPMARNVASGILVTEYADAVEDRHQIYARTASHLEVTLDKSLDDLARRLVE